MRRKGIVLAVVAYILGIATPYAVWEGQHLLVYLWSDHREISRQTSPDGILDAVVIQDNPGAMSSFVYSLYLVPRGTKVSYFHTDPYIVNTSEGNELTVSWDKPHFLRVNAGNAHIKWFANLWYSGKVPDYYVQLTLATGDYLRPNGGLRVGD